MRFWGVLHGFGPAPGLFRPRQANGFGAARPFGHKKRVTFERRVDTVILKIEISNTGS